MNEAAIRVGARRVYERAYDAYRTPAKRMLKSFICTRNGTTNE